MPLFEAEQDRDELRCLKEQMEGEAVNIVASGLDPYWKVIKKMIKFRALKSENICFIS